MYTCMRSTVLDTKNIKINTISALIDLSHTGGDRDIYYKNSYIVRSRVVKQLNVG